MKKMFSGWVTAVLRVSVIATLVLPVGCGKKEEAQTPVVDERAINEYSHENVFEETYRKVQANPKNVDDLYHLADLYDRQGRYQQAVDTFRKVIELDPDLGYAYFKMGTAYSRMNQPEKAIEVLRQAAEIMPNNPVVLNNLGIAYGKIDRLDEEIAAFKKALEIRPRYSSARLNLALVYLKQGDRQHAQEQYEALKEFDVTMAARLLQRIEAGN